MASTSETGHAKNVANLQNLVSFYTGYGTPTTPHLKIVGGQLTVNPTSA